MHKIVIVFTILLFCFGAVANAQDTFTPYWNAGFDFRGALPIGDFKDITDFGVGGTGTVAYNVAPQVAITGRAGYIYFGGKELSYASGTTSGSIKWNYGMIPILAGVKLFFTEGDSRVYVAGEAGLYISTVSADITLSSGTSSASGSGSDTQSKFGVSSSLGAQFKAGDNMVVDAHGNFSNDFADNVNLSWITFAIGFEWMLN